MNLSKDIELDYLNEYELRKTIADNIKKYRREKNISVSELAETLDITNEYVRQIEAPNSKKVFSLFLLYKVAFVLDIKIDDLIERKD